MQPEYTIIQGLEEFTAAREQFAALVTQLQSNQALRMEHDEIEELISHEGTELLRRLLQGHLDLRAAKETKREGCVANPIGNLVSRQSFAVIGIQIITL